MDAPRRGRSGLAAIGATAALIAGALSSGLFAPPSQAADPVPSWASRPVDAQRSSAVFAVRILKMRRLPGSFGALSGFVRNDTALRQFDIDLRIDARTLQMRRDSFTRWAKSDEFFDATRYPWIRVQALAIPAERIRQGGPVTATVNLRGIDRPVPVELQAADCARPGIDCPVRARATLSRSTFGMMSRQLIVDDEVRIEIELMLGEA